MSAVEAFMDNAKIDALIYYPLPVFADKVGMSKNAIQKKIQAGKWLEGQEYIKDPDGKVHINIIAYQKWVESVWQAKKEQEEAFTNLETSSRLVSTGSAQTAAVSRIDGSSRHRRKLTQ